MIRKICVFVGSRANYSSIKSAMLAINEHPDLELQLVLGASALLDRYGQVSELIKADGFKISGEVYMLLEGETPTTMAKSTGIGLMELPTVFERLQPDIVLTVGDRFETMATTIAASYMNIPVAHTMGGEVTGTIDESIRHAVTKFAHIHFPASNDAKNRIIKLGEEKWRVKNFGYSAMDYVKLKNYATRKEIENKLDIKITKPIILFTQHPIPMEKKYLKNNFTKIFNAIERLSKLNVQIIITYPNSDFGAKEIIDKINKLKKFKNIKIIRSLGRYFYHGILSLNKKNTKVICAGNSSSGIKETAIFKCPVVNIGPRQNGRFRSGNVFDVNYDNKKIYNIIFKCINDKEIYKKCLNSKNLYGGGNTGKKIRKFIENLKTSKSKILLKKITY